MILYTFNANLNDDDDERERERECKVIRHRHAWILWSLTRHVWWWHIYYLNLSVQAMLFLLNFAISKILKKEKRSLENKFTELIDFNWISSYFLSCVSISLKRFTSFYLFLIINKYNWEVSIYIWIRFIVILNS